MKVFRTSNYGYEIEECEVISETTAFYTYTKPSGIILKERKVSTYNTFHTSRNEAENYLLNRIDRDIKYALEKIENLKKEREKLISGKSC